MTTPTTRSQRTWTRILIGLGLVVPLILAGLMITGAGWYRTLLSRGGACGWSPPEEKAEVVLACRVVTPDGAAADGAEVLLRRKGDRIWSGSWTRVEDGRGEVLTTALGRRVEAPLVGAYEVLVRAPGYAPVMESVHFPVDGEPTFAVAEGRRLTVTLTPGDARPLPEDARPELVLPVQGDSIWPSSMSWSHERDTWLLPMQRQGVAEVRNEGDGAFSFLAPGNTDRVRVLVDWPGYLRGYDSGDVPLHGEDRIDIVLPEPARLAIEIDPDVGDVLGRGKAHLYVGLNQRTGKHGYQLASGFVAKPVDHAAEDWYAPGTYSLNAQYSRNGDAEQTIARVEGEGEFTLAAGEEQRRVLRLLPVTEQDLRGEGRATLTVLRPDGTPAEDASYQVMYSDSTIRHAVIAKGTIGTGGILELDGLKNDDRHETFYLSVEGDRVGHFFFRGDERYVKRTFTLPVGEGDPAPDCRLVRLADGETFSLSSLRGQVVFLDFWATWCGPCQDPMAKLNELAQQHGEPWAGRVALVGISLDEDESTVTDWIDDRGWTAPLQTWALGGGWKSEAAVAYGISGVPTGILIDPEGMIVWRGHPSRRGPELEDRIQALLGNEGG